MGERTSARAWVCNLPPGRDAVLSHAKTVHEQQDVGEMSVAVSYRVLARGRTTWAAGLLFVFTDSGE